jgi:hypothetical protein
MTVAKKYIGVLDVQYADQQSHGGVERTVPLDRQPSLRSLQTAFSKYLGRKAPNKGRWMIEIYVYKWCTLFNEPDELDEIIHLKTY